MARVPPKDKDEQMSLLQGLTAELQDLRGHEEAMKDPGQLLAKRQGAVSVPWLWLAGSSCRSWTGEGDSWGRPDPDPKPRAPAVSPHPSHSLHWICSQREKNGLRVHFSQNIYLRLLVSSQLHL